MGDIKWLGYTELLLRSGNEAAIVSLLAAALRKLKAEEIEQVAREKLPDYDSECSQASTSPAANCKAWLREASRRDCARFTSDVQLDG